MTTYTTGEPRTTLESERAQSNELARIAAQFKAATTPGGQLTPDELNDIKWALAPAGLGLLTYLVIALSMGLP
jgi:hypothetical protein